MATAVVAIAVWLLMATAASSQHCTSGQSSEDDLARDYERGMQYELATTEAVNMPSRDGYPIMYGEKFPGNVLRVPDGTRNGETVYPCMYFMSAYRNADANIGETIEVVGWVIPSEGLCHVVYPGESDGNLRHLEPLSSFAFSVLAIRSLDQSGTSFFRPVSTTHNGAAATVNQEAQVPASTLHKGDPVVGWMEADDRRWLIFNYKGSTHNVSTVNLQHHVLSWTHLPPLPPPTGLPPVPAPS